MWTFTPWTGSPLSPESGSSSSSPIPAFEAKPELMAVLHHLVDHRPLIFHPDECFYMRHPLAFHSHSLLTLQDNSDTQYRYINLRIPYPGHTLSLCAFMLYHFQQGKLQTKDMDDLLPTEPCDCGSGKLYRSCCKYVIRHLCYDKMKDESKDESKRMDSRGLCINPFHLCQDKAFLNTVDSQRHLEMDRKSRLRNPHFKRRFVEWTDFGQEKGNSFVPCCVFAAFEPPSTSDRLPLKPANELDTFYFEVWHAIRRVVLWLLWSQDIRHVHHQAFSTIAAVARYLQQPEHYERVWNQLVPLLLLVMDAPAFSIKGWFFSKLKTLYEQELKGDHVQLQNQRRMLESNQASNHSRVEDVNQGSQMLLNKEAIPNPEVVPLETQSQAPRIDPAIAAMEEVEDEKDHPKRRRENEKEQENEKENDIFNLENDMDPTQWTFTRHTGLTPQGFYVTAEEMLFLKHCIYGMDSHSEDLTFHRNRCYVVHNPLCYRPRQRHPILLSRTAFHIASILYFHFRKGEVYTNFIHSCSKITGYRNKAYCVNPFHLVPQSAYRRGRARKVRKTLNLFERINDIFHDDLVEDLIQDQQPIPPYEPCMDSNCPVNLVSPPLCLQKEFPWLFLPADQVRLEEQNEYQMFHMGISKVQHWILDQCHSQHIRFVKNLLLENEARKCQVWRLLFELIERWNKYFQQLCQPLFFWNSFQREWRELQKDEPMQDQNQDQEQMTE